MRASRARSHEPAPLSAPPMNAWRAPAFAFLLLLAAILLPPFNAPRTTYDYLVVFDITQSMNVEDYELDGAPVSRLTYMRAAVRRTLHELPCGSRVGWGVFAEYRTFVLL